MTAFGSGTKLFCRQPKAAQHWDISFSTPNPSSHEKLSQHLSLFLSLCCCLWSCKSDLDSPLEIQKVNPIKIKGDIPSTGFAVQEFPFLKSGRNERGTQFIRKWALHLLKKTL